MFVWSYGGEVGGGGGVVGRVGGCVEWGMVRVGVGGVVGGGGVGVL